MLTNRTHVCLQHVSPAPTTLTRCIRQALRSARSSKPRSLQVACSSVPAAAVRALDVSRALCRARKEESHRQAPLFADPYADALLSTAAKEHQALCDPRSSAMDIIATRYIDDTLVNALGATNLNTIQSGDYRQVVLLGDGMDTRPYRLAWPPGTLVFLVAPPEVQELAEAVLAQQGARMARGCLLRRVSAKVQGPSSAASSFLPDLERAGFRPDRLSLWATQGLAPLGLDLAQLQSLFNDMTNGASYGSLLLGEVPGAMTKAEAANLLASYGLMASVLGFGTPETDYGRWSPELAAQPPSSPSLTPSHDQAPQRWLFTSQQQRLSMAQMDTYHRFVEEFSQVDEDYTDNIG